MSRGEGELLTVLTPRAVGLLPVCLTMKPVGEPDALIGHVRFDSSSTQRWNGVPRGTMDEVSSHVCLDLPFATVRPSLRLFHLVFESHDGRALVPIPKRSTSP